MGNAADDGEQSTLGNIGKSPKFGTLPQLHEPIFFLFFVVVGHRCCCRQATVYGADFRRSPPDRRPTTEHSGRAALVMVRSTVMLWWPLLPGCCGEEVLPWSFPTRPPLTAQALLGGLLLRGCFACSCGLLSQAAHCLGRRPWVLRPLPRTESNPV